MMCSSGSTTIRRERQMLVVVGQCCCIRITHCRRRRRHQLHRHNVGHTSMLYHLKLQKNQNIPSWRLGPTRRNNSNSSYSSDAAIIVILIGGVVVTNSSMITDGSSTELSRCCCCCLGAWTFLELVRSRTLVVMLDARCLVGYYQGRRPKMMTMMKYVHHHLSG
jgi:hypothetical protein